MEEPQDGRSLGVQPPMEDHANLDMKSLDLKVLLVGVAVTAAELGAYLIHIRRGRTKARAL